MGKRIGGASMKVMDDEVSAGTKSATSYLRLEICIHRQWVEIAKEEMKYAER